MYHFYPSAKSRIELIIKTSGVICRGASAHHVQKTIAPPKRHFLEKKINPKCFWKKNRRKVFWGVEKLNVGNRLKRVFPKFHAERSHLRGVNGRSKFAIFFRRRKMKCRESSETCFGQVSRRSEPCSGGKTGSKRSRPDRKDQDQCQDRSGPETGPDRTGFEPRTKDR